MEYITELDTPDRLYRRFDDDSVSKYDKQRGFEALDRSFAVHNTEYAGHMREDTSIGEIEFLHSLFRPGILGRKCCKQRKDEKNVAVAMSKSP